MIDARTLKRELEAIASTLDAEPVTLAYPCAGQDTKVFTFTHPDLFASRLPGVPAPNLYIMNDKDPIDDLRFEDEGTSIATLSRREIADGCLHLEISWESRMPRDWMKPENSRRTIPVVWITADWRELSAMCGQAGLIPDFVVGVTDGCAFGGNSQCLNDLSICDRHGLTIEQARRIPTSRYWITDHFSHRGLRYEGIPNPLPTGGIVRPKPGSVFPYMFRKLALLSTDWGIYGQWGPIGGATVFEVLPNDALGGAR